MKNKKILFILQLVVNLMVIAIMISPSISTSLTLPNNPDLAKPIPGAEPVLLEEIINIIATVGRFFVIIAPIILIIALAWASITYMRAGGNQETTKKAKEMFKYSVIGGFVIFGVGVIINTIAAVVSREFFCSFSVLGVCIY